MSDAVLFSICPIYDPLPFEYPVTLPELGVHVQVKVVPATVEVNVIFVEVLKQIVLFRGELETFGGG